MEKKSALEGGQTVIEILGGNPSTSHRALEMLGVLQIVASLQGVMISSLIAVLIFGGIFAPLVHTTIQGRLYPVVTQNGHLSIEDGGAHVYQHTYFPENNTIWIHELPQPFFPVPGLNTSYVSTYMPAGYVYNCTAQAGGNLVTPFQRGIYVLTGGTQLFSYQNLGSWMVVDLTHPLYLISSFMVLTYLVEMVFAFLMQGNFVTMKEDTRRLCFISLHMLRRFLTVPTFYACILTVLGVTDQGVLAAATTFTVVLQLLRWQYLVASDRYTANLKKKLDGTELAVMKHEFQAGKGTLGVYAFLECFRLALTLAAVSNGSVKVDSDLFGANFLGFMPLSLYITFVVLLILLSAYDFFYLGMLHRGYEGEFNSLLKGSSTASTNHCLLDVIDIFFEVIVISVILGAVISYLDWGTLTQC